MYKGSNRGALITVDNGVQRFIGDGQDVVSKWDCWNGAKLYGW